jgi:hypothetical protein
MDDVVTQLGLILTQLRVVRLTVEEIERGTARYGNFAFATATAAGAKFGEPPMFQGALRVYVVNIEDLAPGSGFGGFLEALLGGVGRFFGGFFGGLIGGTISAASVLFIIKDLAKLADHVDSILERLGIGKQAPVEKDKDGKPKPGQPPPAPGLDLPNLLKSLEESLKTLTGLFEAATTAGPKASTNKEVEPAVTDRWTQMLRLAHTMLTDIARVVNGLILLIPLVVGALAWLISKLDTLKVAFLELLQFILRNALLLRGVALAVIFDTISAAARLAGTVLGILADAVKSILDSIFKIIGAVLTVAIDGLKILTAALAAVINALTDWLAGPLMVLLERIANSLLFRFLMHVVRVLPAVLPPLYELLREKGDPDKGIKESPPLDSTQLQALKDAAALSLPSPTTFTGAVTKVTSTKFPDLLGGLSPAADITKLPKLLADQGKVIQDETAKVFATAEAAVTKLDTALKAAATKGEADFNARLKTQIAEAEKAASTLASVLDPALAKARVKKETGLELVAQAYEKWASGGGLELVLKNVDEHFKTSPAVPAEILGAGKSSEKVPVTIEIQDMVIEIEVPPPAGAASPSTDKGVIGPIGAITGEECYTKIVAYLHELKERGGDNLAAGPLFVQHGTGA